MNIDKITAGDTLDFRTTVPDYPAGDGWVLVYRLVPRAAGTAITLTGTADGDQHRIQAGISVTALWVPGVYSWVAYATKTGERYTLQQGSVEILPDPSTAATLDTRSGARKALDAVTAYLADPSNITAAKYQIAGRSLDRFPLPELWTHRDRLVVEVQKEEQAARLAAGLPDTRRVFVRFGAR
jgi:hypothetical protein